MSDKSIDKMSMRELRIELRVLRGTIEVSGGLKCPNCDDEGYTVEVESRTEYDSDPWDPDGDPIPVDMSELVQVQCEFCYSVQDSIFNRRIADERKP